MPPSPVSTTTDPVWVDDLCNACGLSVAPRFPHDDPPLYCDACDDEFMRELRAGHVRDALSGEVVLPVEEMAA